ncbi:MAG: AAA family ATPase [Bacteroidota bacterium]
MSAPASSGAPESFRLTEEPGLEGTFRVVIRSPQPIALDAPSALLCHKERRCAVLVDAVESGPERLVLADAQVKRFLAGSNPAPRVTVAPCMLADARSAELHVPARCAGQAETESWIRTRLAGKPLTEGMEFRLFGLFGGNAQDVPVRVAHVAPGPSAALRSSTAVVFKPLTRERENTIGVRWQDIGGLDKAVLTVRELVEFPMRYREIMAEIGIEPPRGILLYGPPGTGKTLIARALAGELDAHFFFIQGPEILSAYQGKSEENLRLIFEKAEQEAADGRLAVILIDEVDSIAPKRDAGHGETSAKLVAMLLTLMEGLKAKRGVVVLGTTNRPDALDPALRRPGRFEYEIHCGIPDARGRERILRIHSRAMPLDPGVDLGAWAEKTHGFTGADLAMLCREAGRCTFRRLLRTQTGQDISSPDFVPPVLDRAMLADDAVRVTAEDFERAGEVVSPSGMREVLVQIPKDVTWATIGGLREVVRIIEENIIRPLRHPDVFRRMGIRPARGLLMHGPPGTGKTLLAKAIANECGANFISIKGPELRSKWFGESEEKVRHVFDTARKHAPCVIFFDEVDSMMPSRGKGTDSGLTDSIVNQFLAEMDGVQSTEGVFVIGATNRPDLIDEALMRAGRFDYHVQVPLPDAAARRQILAIHLRNTPLAPGVDLEALVEQTDTYSGAALAEICRLAGLIALREKEPMEVNPIRQEHLLAALKESAERDGSTRFVKHRIGFV